MHTLTHTYAKQTALNVALKEGLRDVTKIIEDWTEGFCSFYIYGTMHFLDPDTYINGQSPMVVRVTHGNIDLVDGQ